MIQSLKQFLSITQQDLQRPVFTKQKDKVFYLVLNTKANAFTHAFVRQIHSELDKIQAHQGPTAMVTVSLSKVFSGGLDLKYISNLQPQDQTYMVVETTSLVGRIAVLPFPTFCLVRGGAVAGGSMLAFSHDCIYVAGKGMFWINQSQNQLFFPPGMLAIIANKHAYPSALRDMVVFSEKFHEKQALQNRIIDGILSEQVAINVIHEKASKVCHFGKNKEVMKKIKCQLYSKIVVGCFEKQGNPRTIAYQKMKPFPKL